MPKTPWSVCRSESRGDRRPLRKFFRMMDKGVGVELDTKSIFVIVSLAILKNKRKLMTRTAKITKKECEKACLEPAQESKMANAALRKIFLFEK
jgi:hypothetical protein